MCNVRFSYLTIKLNIFFNDFNRSFFFKGNKSKFNLVCRLALRVKYPKFGTEGFTALYTRYMYTTFMQFSLRGCYMNFNKPITYT